MLDLEIDLVICGTVRLKGDDMLDSCINCAISFNLKRLDYREVGVIVRICNELLGDILKLADLNYGVSASSP